MSKRALIFGVGGFVGGYLSKELRECGYRVYGSDRSTSAVGLNLDEYRQCDLADASRVKEVCRELLPSVIINLAAVSSVGLSWKIPQETMKINVGGTINVLEAAKDMAQKPKVLLIGSSEEYSPSCNPLCESDDIDAMSPYGISKVTQERFAKLYEKRYGLQIYRTRSFNHTGAGQADTFVLPSWCKQVAQIEIAGKPGSISVGNLDVVRDFSDVRDVVRAYRLIIESPFSGEVFNIGSQNSYSLRDLLQKILDFSTQDIFIEVPKSLLRPDDTPIVSCDGSKARELLGYAPVYSIEETLRGLFSYELRKLQ